MFILPVNDAAEYGVLAGKQFAPGDVVFTNVFLYNVDHDAAICQYLALTPRERRKRGAGGKNLPPLLHLFHHIAFEALPCVEDFCSDDNCNVAWAKVSHHACWFVNSILLDDPPYLHSNVAFDDYIEDGKEGSALGYRIATRDIGVGEDSSCAFEVCIRATTKTP